MLSRLARQSLLLLTLLAYLLAGPVGASNYVLCIGADGHAAFEPRHENACGRDGVCPAPAQTDSHCDKEAEHGTPCTDVTATLSSQNTRGKPTLHAPPVPDAPSFVATVPLTLAARTVVRPPRNLQTAPPARTLLILRTTVLRC